MTTIRASIYTDLRVGDAHRINISDNTMHNDLTDMEKAYKARYMKDELGFGVAELADIFGVRKSAVYNYLRVTKLDEWTRAALHKGHITLIHAVELSTVKDLSQRLRHLRVIRQQSMSVREYKKYKKEGKYLTRIWFNVDPTVDKAKALVEYMQSAGETNIVDAYNALREYFDRDHNGVVAADYRTLEDLCMHIQCLEMQNEYIVKFRDCEPYFKVITYYDEEIPPGYDFDQLIEACSREGYTYPEEVKEQILKVHPSVKVIIIVGKNKCGKWLVV